ncbi:MAG TPA: YdeI/OmpD-associated family protein, partial [Thermomicrobiales bacterium]
RRPKSMWSRVNCEKAMALIADGRMQLAGLRQVELAKSDGRWDAAYEPPSTISIPDDLQRALDENQAARDFFSTLDSRNRYAILFRIHTAKRLETRAARIATFIDMLSKHEKIHP